MVKITGVMDVAQKLQYQSIWKLAGTIEYFGK
jgi:hypothetical protein